MYKPTMGDLPHSLILKISDIVDVKPGDSIEKTIENLSSKHKALEEGVGEAYADMATITDFISEIRTMVSSIEKVKIDIISREKLDESKIRQ